MSTMTNQVTLLLPTLGKMKVEIGEDGVEVIKTAEPPSAGPLVNQRQKKYLYLARKNQRERR